ncbi:Ank2, partial [Symbiodinium sp. KB8]
MLSFLYDSGWLGQLLAPTDVTPEDELYDACFLGDAERAQVLLERAASALRASGRSLHSRPVAPRARCGAPLPAPASPPLPVAGVSARAANGAGNKPIHAAALSGSTRTLNLLKEAGCDVNARGTQGNVPLHLAAGKANAAAVEWLLAAGAIPTLRNDAGYTPVGVLLEILDIDEAADEGALAAAGSAVRRVVSALRRARPEQAHQSKQEEARATDALARGGDAAHLPPPPSSIDTT